MQSKTAKVLTTDIAESLKGKKIRTIYFGHKGQDGVDEFVVGACKYMVKRILLCDWEGNITWNRDFDFNYTKDQILHKNKLKREDEIIKKWMETL